MGSSTSGTNHREHALHNKDVYEHLRNNVSEYIDWIITTAFYTSLHFVEHKIYPFNVEIGGRKHKVKSTEEYMDYSAKRSKHQARIKAVKRKLSSCKVAYKQLFDLSMTARYHQYKFNDPKKMDGQVEKWMNTIVTECNS